VAVGGTGGVQVIVQKSAYRRVPLGGWVRGSQDTSVLANKIVEVVTAPCAFLDQVAAEEVIQESARPCKVGAAQGGGGVSVEGNAGV
jgi:hypothetical protein